MKKFWKTDKQIMLKGIVIAALCVVFTGVGMMAAYRQIWNVNENIAQASSTVTENYQLAAVSAGGTLTAYIDWEQQDLKLVSTTGDDYFYISDARQRTWDEVEAEKGIAYCDLSWITKEYELNIKGEKNPSDSVKITIAAPRSLKAKFELVNGQPALTMTVTEVIDKKKVTTELNPAGNSSVQWRKGTTGNWQPYSTLDLDRYFTKGIKLNIRLAGECSTDLSKCYLPSKVASVKVAKKKNAPSVKIDEEKLVLGVKRGQEYVVTIDGKTSEVISISDRIYESPSLADIANKALVGDGYTTPFNAFSVKVRTAATEKKAASKWKMVSYPAQRTVASNALTATYEVEGTNTGAVLKNNTTYDIEYFVASDNRIQSVTGAEINAKTKWSKVKAGTEARYRSRAFLMTTDTAIFFRYVAEKDDTKTPENEAALPSTVAITHAVGESSPVQP